jgi:type I restriction enzyme M protein
MIAHTPSDCICQLAERYATPLPQLTKKVAALAAKVDQHLQKRGALWK